MKTAHTKADLWKKVKHTLTDWAKHDKLFCSGQDNSLAWIAERLPHNGVLIADEVGLGKTRLAVWTMLATLKAGGNVAVVAPAGLLKQWDEEARKTKKCMVDNGLISLKDKELMDAAPVCLRSYDDLFENTQYPLAKAGDGRWVLISQSFDLYQIRNNAKVRRLELPALVKAHQAEKEKAHRNDRWLKYREDQGYLKTKNALMKGMDNAAKHLAKFIYSGKLEEVFNNERLRPSRGGDMKADDESINFFRQRDDNEAFNGRDLLMHMVGKLIGPIDLLIIDEAHKSREEDGQVTDDDATAEKREAVVPVKQLNRLIKTIIQKTTDTRHLCMTATPVELDTNQWDSIIRRTLGKNSGHADNAQKAVERFGGALEAVKRHPDHAECIDELQEAASEFQGVLAPFVTRRRRINQSEMRKKLKKAGIQIANNGAHPHRKYCDQAKIDIAGLDDNWRQLLLAYEGAGLAAKGADNSNHVGKRIGIQYPSGHIGDTKDRESVKPHANAPAKEWRRYAWQQLQDKLCRHRDHQEWLWSHPRILCAVDEIEKWCDCEQKHIPDEKVLVFGVYIKPLEALQEVLNARHALWTAIHNGYLPHKPDSDEEKVIRLVIKKCKTRPMDKLAKPLGRSSPDTWLARIKKAYGRYGQLLKKVRRKLSDKDDAVFKKWPGDVALKKLSPIERKRLFEYLRAEVVEDFLRKKEKIEGKQTHEISKLARAAWERHIPCILHGHDDEPQSPNEVEGTENVKGKKRELDQQADRIKPEDVAEYLEHLDKSPRRYCAFLHGGVAMAVRQAMQGAFNRKVYPHVLIAQSKVGREGLNLHEECRRVFLFHPEWNPGVMEQQIGRVDRIKSLWEKMVGQKEVGKGDNAPKIEIMSLVFDGTYDAHQYHVLQKRRSTLNAQLFGALLDEETLANVREEYHEKLEKAAPDWEPKRKMQNTSAPRE